MGEAGRRGTFEQRKEKAVIKRKAMVKATLKELESEDADCAPEEKSKRSHAQIAMLSFMMAARRYGLSAKEATRRLKRHKKKSAQ